MNKMVDELAKNIIDIDNFNSFCQEEDDWKLN